jgi:hypothetical protein
VLTCGAGGCRLSAPHERCARLLRRARRELRPAVTVLQLARFKAARSAVNGVARAARRARHVEERVLAGVAGVTAAIARRRAHVALRPHTARLEAQQLQRQRDSHNRPADQLLAGALPRAGARHSGGRQKRSLSLGRHLCRVLLNPAAVCVGVGENFKSENAGQSSISSWSSDTNDQSSAVVY